MKHGFIKAASVTPKIRVCDVDYNYQTIFKRSCLPDGPKVGSVAVSLRGDLRMPTDACASIWMKELDYL